MTLETPAPVQDPALGFRRVAPLSFAQERIWFADAAAPGNPTYNVPLFFLARARVDVSALAAALRSVVDRHEILRTRYRIMDGRPVQQVLDEVPIEVHRTDLTGVPDAADRALAEATEFGSTPFDLTAGPVLRAAVWQGGSDGDAVLLLVHHIAVDGWSLAPLFEDLTVAYRAAQGRAVTDLAALPIQYADFAMRDRAALADPRIKSQATARAVELAAIAGGLTLSGCSARPAAPDGSRHGDQRTFAIPRSVWTAATQLARSVRATPFVLLLAVAEVLVAQWSGRREFLLGAMTANRAEADLHRAVGFFVNTVPLRCTVSPETSFRELCTAVRAEFYPALSHQRLPFDRLTAEVTALRASGRAALIDVGFVLQNMVAPAWDDDASPWCRPVVLGTATAKFDLLLTLDEFAEGAVLTVEHDTERYSTHAVDEIGESYVRILTAVVGSLDTPVGKLPGHPRSFPVVELAPEPNAAAMGAPATIAEAERPDAERRAAVELFATTLPGGLAAADRANPQADFFALGGQSLLAITMLAEAQRRHGVVVLPRDFLAEPTIGGLARLLAQRRGTDPPPDGPRPGQPTHPDTLRPASSVQQRFWTIDRLPALRTAYLLPSVVEYTGQVDRLALRRAVDTVLSWHSALRARFTLDRKLRRVCYRTDGAPATAELVDASSWSDDDLHSHLSQTCWSGFDLAVGPPVRAEVLARGDETLLVLVMHHIVADGWSRGLLLEHIAAEYREPGHLDRHPPVEAAELSSATVEVRGVADVVERLRGAPIDVALPFDQPRAESQHTLAATQTTALGVERLAQLRDTVIGAGSTTFMTTAALLATVLARRSDQRDFLFAFPWAGRDDARSAQVVGMFVNTLVLRVDLSGNPSWRALLARVRDSSMFSFRHADVPFDEVVAELHRERDLSRPPLTPVYLSFQEGPEVPLALGPRTGARYRALDPLHLKYELELMVTDLGDDLELTVSYSAHLFDPPTMAALLDDLKIAADDLASDLDSHPL